MDKLKGKKTYIIAAVMAIATALQYLGMIDTAVYQSIMTMLGVGGIATLRHGMKS